METKQEKTYFYWIDALRFLAAFFVLFSHSRNGFFLPFNELPPEQHTPIAYAFYSLGRLGHEAVIIFFVLSGFLVGGANLERIHQNNFNVTNYAIDRCVRIYLPLVTSVILYFLVCILVGNNFDVICAIGNLLNLQCTFVEPLVSVYWSLAYEMWFYIALMGLSMIVQGKKGGWGFIILLATCFMFISGLEMFYLFIWFIGAFAYFVRSKRKNTVILIMAFLLMGVSVIYSQLLTDSNAIHISTVLPKNRYLPELSLSLAICMLIQQLILRKPNTRIAVIIESCFSKLAAFSYTLYLSHRIFFIILFKYLFDEQSAEFTYKGLLMWIVFVTIVLLCCYSLYRVSEYYTTSVKVYIKSLIRKNK